MKPIIEITALTAAYENKTVFENISLVVQERDFLVCTGPNGGGKTTLIKCMLKLLRPVSGSIQFYKNGLPVKDLSMGYLPQYNAIDKQFPITVNEVVLSGLDHQKALIGKYSKEQREKANQSINKMGLQGLEQYPIGKLSGGQIQRALLARAIVSHPEVLILDEPNTYIDNSFQSKLYELLAEINKESAVILVSHDIHSAMKLAKRVVYVNHGIEIKDLNEKSTGYNTK